MGLEWEKRGHIYTADWGGMSYGKARAFISLPDRIRCYPICYQPRDAAGMTLALSYALDLDPKEPHKILVPPRESILPLGGYGTFDEFGIMAECAVVHGNDVYLYYDGWTRCTSVPYNWAIGLAISHDGGESFEKVGLGPVVGATLHEPFLQASPTVQIAGDGLWHMWYLSGTSWISAGSGYESRYVIMHATSTNGIDWARSSRPTLPTVLEDECQAGATVFWHDDRYHMIFSYRHGADFRKAGRGYRLGYAHSADLERWIRDDAALILRGPSSGWDSDMQCYPTVLQYDGRVFLFYNGNNCGQTGFGYAELVSS